ncbi:MAG: hypothetical protein A2Y64_05155 [Candidatus Coatesbacteria bacterium RBG_13_66_14]|uniref:Inhibitor I9 domain-containing protein n=1 Tax=Candidatus Coatesbacteria bacterium RBG_13_66_14 TaxID=1817816 RepID=A0A1F5FB56_9BACT|nr:MAG: hypothetical protein A2Y64_05155 [Candidatus Coatesbacteria bacterium RBG_13_66_14]
MRKVLISVFMVVALILLTGADTGEVWGPDAPKTTSNHEHARPQVIVIMLAPGTDMTAVSSFNATQHVNRMEHVTGQIYRLYLEAGTDMAAARSAYARNALFTRVDYEVEVSYEVHAGCAAGGGVSSGR